MAFVDSSIARFDVITLFANRASRVRFSSFREHANRAQPHPSRRDKCNFYFRLRTRPSRLVSSTRSPQFVLTPFKCWSPRKSTSSALRSPPALRSSISSEGSLLFVVCPSRISTHSVSAKRKTGIIFPFPPSSLSFLSFSLMPPAPPPLSVSSSFVNEDDKTALSALRGVPRRSKWRRQRYSCVAALASSCAICCGPTRNVYISLFRRPLCRCNQGFRRWRPGRPRAYKDSAAEWS